jgi:hypothetical protein
VFRVQDGSGESFWRRESGLDQKGRYLVNKAIVYNTALGPQRPLEKEVIFAEWGQLDHQPLLRPWRSQYRVWLDGKEHFTEMQLDLAQRKMKVKMRSPDPRWNGTQEVKFPAGKVFCFYGQLAECLRVQGFLPKALQKRSGQLNFILIWEGYPYQQEQYPPIAGLFTPAVVEYDGEYQEGLTRFSVSFGEQVFFILVDEHSRLQKLFWVAQGLSVEVVDGKASVPAPLEETPSFTPTAAATAPAAAKKWRWADDHPAGNLGQLDDGTRSR